MAKNNAFANANSIVNGANRTFDIELMTKKNKIKIYEIIYQF